MESYAAFNVVGAGTLFKAGAEELEKISQNDHNIVLGRVVVCADKILTLTRKSLKEFESEVDLHVQAKLREHISKVLGIRINNSAHLWEVLRASARHMNDIKHASKDERVKARKICACLSAMFPDH